MNEAAVETGLGRVQPKYLWCFAAGTRATTPADSRYISQSQSGTEIRVPIKKLAQDDQAYLKQFLVGQSPLASRPQDEIRFWTDNTKRFKVSAQYLGIENDTVKLLKFKPNPYLSTIPLPFPAPTQTTHLLRTPSGQFQELPSPPNFSNRTWVDITNSFKIDAWYLGMERNEVKLLKKNGVEIRVPLMKMSVRDREWIREEELGKLGMRGRGTRL